METYKRTPLQLFNLPQHFVIPLFQRPYVWKEDLQWEPLWQDICRVVELRTNQPHLNAQHFLGAIVLQAHEAGSNRVMTWNVIDGQQRLTTLQILMDAAQGVLAAAGSAHQASQLWSLTHNPESYIPEGQSQLKLRHLNNDHASFDEVMSAEAPIDYASLKQSDSQINKAHQYFSTAVSQWLGDPADRGFAEKAEQLAGVLQSDLQLVTIELLSTENSQEIFETLNARGTPLTAADLVRNFVFQRLEAEGEDTKKAYKEDWPFEAKFWGKEVSVGRYPISRSSLFLNQWLVSRLGEAVGPQSTFTRFKSYVEHQSGQTMGELLPVLKAQALQYEVWTESAARPGGNLSIVEMSVYRMNASGVEVLKPLLIWLHEPGRDVRVGDIDRVVAAAESWIVRRQLLSLPSGDLGRVVADIIRVHSSIPTDELADQVITHLARLDVASTYWPGDQEIRRTLSVESAYRRYPRARLRALLEAIENKYRAETKQPQVERAGFPIEHILPQKWKETWPVDSIEAEQDRQDRVHRWGNLTLLTSSLNSKVSNGAWVDKRRALLAHNTLKLTGRLVERTEQSDWNEVLIDQRTAELIDQILAIWPIPTGHQGRIIDPQSKVQDWVELKHLVEAGLLTPGDTITPVPVAHATREAVIGEDAWIHIDGKKFGTPSGAARHVRRSHTNGWYFWGFPGGRRLNDVRTAFLNAAQGEDPGAASS